jgi:uroporphyrinogen decarboxylase
MNALNRLSLVLAGQRADRIPFVPAIYEHKAALIGETPSNVCRDQTLLVRALEEEYRIYDPDLLVVGIDVYNVEPEALGAQVKYFTSNDVPSITKRPLENLSGIKSLRVPNPEHAGRMPLILNAGRQIARFIGQEVMVWGAVSGPFSLASNLLRADRLLLMTITDTSFIHSLMELSTKVIIEYAKAWLDSGLEVIMFDSFCSPPLISPNSYRELVLPYQAEIISFLKQQGVEHCPLIIGGNTTEIAEDIAKTGANFILSDYNANLGNYIGVSQQHKIALRANVDPNLVCRGSLEEIREVGKEAVTAGQTHPRFVLGTGVLPYDTPSEHVLALKECVYL